MKKIILIRDHSQESESAEQLLLTHNIEFVKIVTNSEFGSPSLIDSDSAFSYQGLEEISEFTKTKPVTIEQI
jgi:hypothetical protein